MSANPARPKLLLLGANGQVGHALQLALRAPDAPLFELKTITRNELDLGDLPAVQALVLRFKPDWIVNAAAYTAVDHAETQPELAHTINAALPAALAQLAQQVGAALVHYSTDYVFDGQAANAYTETDTVNPQSAYGRSKWAGEQSVAAHCTRHLLLRTCWVFGAHGGNFLKTMLRLAQQKTALRVVADQWGAPTSAQLIAHTTLALMQQAMRQPLWGTYHLSASGRTNWHAYATAAIASAQQLGLATQLNVANIEAIPAANYPTPAPRPSNSCLNTDKLAAQLGYCLPSWQEGMQHTLNQLAANGWTDL